MESCVHAVTMEDALEWAKEAVLEKGKPRMIATANAEIIMIARRIPSLKEILNTCDLVVPDGAGCCRRKASARRSRKGWRAQTLLKNF